MKRLLLLLALGLLFVRCDQASTYVGVYDFEQHNWQAGQHVVFDYLTSSTRTSGEIRLSLRYLAPAIGSKVLLAVKTTRSHSVYCIDTLDFTLNRGIGDRIRSEQIIVRRDVMWLTSAPHHTTVTPLGDLHDVVSLSIEIDNAIEISH